MRDVGHGLICFGIGVIFMHFVWGLKVGESVVGLEWEGIKRFEGQNWNAKIKLFDVLDCKKSIKFFCY